MRLRTSVAVLLFAARSPAAHLGLSANREFDRYVATVEARLSRQNSSHGIEPANGGTTELDGALLHHWRGAVFVPGADRRDMLTLLRDCEHFPIYYAPEVVSARRLGGVVEMRFKKHAVIPVVLDAEFEIQDGLAGATAGYSFSRSTHIWQIRDRRLPEGDDDGFLWRLNSYWTFRNVPDGLLIECEAVSLTRDIPRGLRWLITPIVKDLPRTSLESTLKATRNALIKEKHQ